MGGCFVLRCETIFGVQAVIVTVAVDTAILFPLRVDSRGVDIGSPAVGTFEIVVGGETRLELVAGAAESTTFTFCVSFHIKRTLPGSLQPFLLPRLGFPLPRLPLPSPTSLGGSGWTGSLSVVLRSCSVAPATSPTFAVGSTLGVGLP